jgi:hypothetical protein
MLERSMSEAEEKHRKPQVNDATAVTSVGYCRPPVHSRFKPGQSGNPSGRAKGSQNLKTLFHRILKEEVSLREGTDVRKVSKAEAIMRSLVVGALKGDTRSIGTLFRLAEQTGQFDEPGEPITSIQRVIVSWNAPGATEEELRGSSEVCRDEAS